MGKRARIENRAKRKQEERRLQAAAILAQLTLVMSDRLEMMTVEQRQELVDRQALLPEYVDRPELFREHYFARFRPNERLLEPEEATVEGWLLDTQDWVELLSASGLSPAVRFALDQEPT